MIKLVSLLFLMTLLSGFQSQKKKVVFFGDSITEAGVKPNGYISVIETLIAKENSATQYELVGAGIGGNKVYDLYLRLEEDVLAQNPDIVVIYVGVNDVWHKRLLGTGTDADKFEKFYTALIKKIQSKGSKLILVTPAMVGEKNDFSNELDGDLNKYSNIIRRLAEKNKVGLVDLRSTFIEYNKLNNRENKENGILTTDGVHLNDTGNALVAREIWKAIKTL